jgi:hypothetical protein
MLLKMANADEAYRPLWTFYAEQVLAAAPGLVPAVTQGVAALEVEL